MVNPGLVMQRERCECHECTQARWKAGLGGITAVQWSHWIKNAQCAGTIVPCDSPERHPDNCEHGMRSKEAGAD